MPGKKISFQNQNGFTLIEIAIVMILIGILTAGGVSLIGTLTKRKARTETLEYMTAAKEALINYGKINGRLPSADTDSDGAGNAGQTAGFLPYIDLQVKPSDTYNRPLRYEINPGLDLDRTTTCSTLLNWNPTSGTRPNVVDYDDASATTLSTAFILISSGPMDADTSGNTFDDIAAGTHTGNNVTGTPNYIRYPEIDAFDDLVLYVGGFELYGEICGKVSLTVVNASATDRYVYNSTDPASLDEIIPGNSTRNYQVLSGSVIQIRTLAGGGGGLVTPPGSTTVSGSGRTINIP